MKNIKFLTIAMFLSFNSFVHGQDKSNWVENLPYTDLQSKKITRDYLAAQGEEKNRIIKNSQLPIDEASAGQEMNYIEKYRAKDYIKEHPKMALGALEDLKQYYEDPNTLFANGEENRTVAIKNIEEQIISIKNKHPELINKPLMSDSIMSGLFNVLNNPTVKPMVLPIFLLSIGALGLYQYYRLMQARQKSEQATSKQAEKEDLQEEKQENNDGAQV